MDTDKQVVKNFYENFGWSKNEEGLYNDTVLFADRRAVLDTYNQKTRLRVKNLLKPSGHLFLDAGSGAIPHPEDLAYSSNYKWRVCVDFSEAALKEARSNLKDRGLYVVADVTKLPFADNVFDAVYSGHVLYHLPKNEQEAAILEFRRTLAPRSICVIIYTWSASITEKLTDRYWATRRVLSDVPAARFIWKKLTGGEKPRNVTANAKTPARPPLYAYPNNYAWFQETFRGDKRIEIRSFSSVDRSFTSTFVKDNWMGRSVLNCVSWIEALFPHLAGRLGKYPLLIISKP